MKIKIRTKLILISVTIVLVMSFTMGWISYYAGRKMLTQRISAHLDSLAQSRAMHIRDFLQHTKESVRIIATSRVLRIGLQNLNVDGSDKASIIRKVNQRLEHYLSKDNERDILDVFILGTNGRVVVSTNPKYIGLD